MGETVDDYPLAVGYWFEIGLNIGCRLYFECKGSNHRPNNQNYRLKNKLFIICRLKKMYYFCKKIRPKINTINFNTDNNTNF